VLFRTLPFDVAHGSTLLTVPEAKPKGRAVSLSNGGSSC
jgi:hypothetical protein